MRAVVMARMTGLIRKSVEKHKRPPHTEKQRTLPKWAASGVKREEKMGGGNQKGHPGPWMGGVEKAILDSDVNYGRGPRLPLSINCRAGLPDGGEREMGRDQPDRYLMSFVKGSGSIYLWKGLKDACRSSKYGKNF